MITIKKFTFYDVFLSNNNFKERKKRQATYRKEHVQSQIAQSSLACSIHSCDTDIEGVNTKSTEL